MNSFFKSTLLTFLLLSLWGCKQQIESLSFKKETRKKIEMTTNYGTMIIELYNETPLHRDNFINLANNKAYDSLLFHRVINKFMIQGGDPDSKKAQTNDTLGNGDAPYVINAEFNSKLFHKKGMLAAARDDNPLKASSAMQFYIVHGKKFNDSLLDLAQIRINKNMAHEYFRADISKKPLLDSIQNTLSFNDMDLYKVLMDRIYSLANTQDDFKPYVIPKKHREVYKSVGGTPHLDQNYTVFGKLIKGMEVLDSIAGIDTNALDRPINDVIIQTVKLMN